ncbi:MAG TPA: hypothetical protein VFS97_08140 [Nitrososphaeraceae archaeon]|nr:hypothetical protein [Nitrososphaeraceae archaeon]
MPSNVITFLAFQFFKFPIPPSFENSTKRIEKLGVYGDCNVYLEGSAGDYKVSHHCAGAEAAGLKPPTQNQTK